MPGNIVLAGGNEFRPGCEGMDSSILEATGVARPRVLIVPTAAVTGPQKAANDGVVHFSSLGADASQLMVLDQAQANDDRLIEAVSGAALVYFTGGNPDYLLATLEGSKFLAKLLEASSQGTIIGGSSAGAMVMGAAMRRPSSDSTRAWAPALGIAQGLGVLPHHERSDPATVAGELKSTVPPELKVLGIDARSCCFGSPGNWKALGNGKVTLYQDGSWTTFVHGETLPEGV